jgi:DNA polymerase III delta prime subunit
MLVGYDSLARSFEKLIREGTLGQSYLLYGDREIGKHDFSRALAGFIETGAWEANAPLLDTVTLEPDEKGTIGIDQVRELRRFLSQTPLVSIRRTALIDGAEALTADAQGALLKLVEEPSSHALLVFTTYEPDALFAPLRSRLTRVYCSRLSRDAVAEFLEKEQELTKVRAKNIAADSFGRIGRALRLSGKAREPAVEGRELEMELERAIMELRRDGIPRNVAKLAWLLERETLIKRFNLNPNLQRKAIMQVLGGS